MSFFPLASSSPRLAARLLLLRKNCRRQLGGAASSYVATFLRAQGVKSSLGRIIGGRGGDSRPYEEGGEGDYLEDFIEFMKTLEPIFAHT